MPEAGGHQQVRGRYAAFISYSHADEEFGDWLHKRLESYQVPSALVGRDGPTGPVKKRLGKVFRDRADLSAAHDLGAEIRQGLEQADALIVLCSPRSCGSKYVNEEIRHFKELGKGGRIFAAWRTPRRRQSQLQRGRRMLPAGADLSPRRGRNAHFHTGAE
jgi:hypothetical protein